MNSPCKSIEVKNMPSGENETSQIEFDCSRRQRTGSFFPAISHKTTDPFSKPLQRNLEKHICTISDQFIRNMSYECYQAINVLLGSVALLGVGYQVIQVGLFILSFFDTKSGSFFVIDITFFDICFKFFY